MRCGQSCLHAPAASTRRRLQTSPCRAHKSVKHTKMDGSVWVANDYCCRCKQPAAH
jgi:hypothetical protein